MNEFCHISNQMPLFFQNKISASFFENVNFLEKNCWAPLNSWGKQRRPPPCTCHLPPCTASQKEAPNTMSSFYCEHAFCCSNGFLQCTSAYNQHKSDKTCTTSLPPFGKIPLGIVQFWPGLTFYCPYFCLPFFPFFVSCWAVDLQNLQHVLHHPKTSAKAQR